MNIEDDSEYKLNFCFKNRSKPQRISKQDKEYLKFKLLKERVEVAELSQIYSISKSEFTKFKSERVVIINFSLLQILKNNNRAYGQRAN